MSDFDEIYRWANNRVEGLTPVGTITNKELYLLIVDLAFAGKELEARLKLLEDERDAKLKRLLASIEWEMKRCEDSSKQLDRILKNIGGHHDNPLALHGLSGDASR